MSTKLKVLKYSRCEGDVEFYCRTCKRYLCVVCIEKHLKFSDTQFHRALIDRLTYSDSMLPTPCDRHQNRYVNNWCFSCELPICAECDEHRNHDILDIVFAYKMCIHQQKDRLLQIRTEIILKNLAILQSNVKMDKEICQSNLTTLYQSMIKRIWKLGHLVDLVVKDTIEIKQLKVLLKSRIKNPKRNIMNTEMFSYKLEQLLDKPVQFIKHIKKTPFPKITMIPDLFSFSLNSEINIMDVNRSVGEIQIKETKKREVRNEQFLELMRAPMLQKSFSVNQNRFVYDTGPIYHISCVFTDSAWISTTKGLMILTNTTFKGELSHCFRNQMRDARGHSVTREGNLIYIDRHNKVVIRLIDNGKENTLIKKIKTWRTECVCSTPSNGDLLVGIRRNDEYLRSEAKVMRYNSTGKQIQVIEHDDTGKKLYKRPKYITENHNRDIIVSDETNGVVVADRRGYHRFSYTGPPSGSALSPLGICVDALSHILVADAESNSIQMIDKDGHFLSLLFTEENLKSSPGALGYDNINNLLWVGTKEECIRIYIYRHIQKKDYLMDDFLK